MNEEENKIVEEYENKENEILESVGKILPEITETKKFQDETSSKRAELYDELKEINNNIYSYPEDEKSIWEDKRESVKLEIKKIEDKISKRRESTEIKIKNVINDVKLELKKIDKAINDKESGIKLYRENIRMAIINEENKLKEEMSKDVSAQDMDKIQSIMANLKQFKETEKSLNKVALEYIKQRRALTNILNNLSYEKIENLQELVDERNKGKQSEERNKKSENKLKDKVCDTKELNKNEK